MGKTRDLFKKIRDTKRIFHAKMGSIKDKNAMELAEAKYIKKDFPGKSTGVECHCLLREYWAGLPFSYVGIFLIQGSNPHFLCVLDGQADSLPLAPPGEQREYEGSIWVYEGKRSNCLVEERDSSNKHSNI